MEAPTRSCGATGEDCGQELSKSSCRIAFKLRFKGWVDPKRCVGEDLAEGTEKETANVKEWDDALGRNLELRGRCGDVTRRGSCEQRWRQVTGGSQRDGEEFRNTGPGVPWLGGPLEREPCSGSQGHLGNSVTGSGNPSHANPNKPRLAAASGHSLGLKTGAQTQGKRR